MQWWPQLRDEVRRLGLVGVQARDRVRHLRGLLLALERASLPGDLHGLPRRRKEEADCDGDDLDAALFHPAVVPIDAAMCGRHSLPRQGLELVIQAGLVALDGEQVARRSLEHRVVRIGCASNSWAVTTGPTEVVDSVHN